MAKKNEKETFFSGWTAFFIVMLGFILICFVAQKGMEYLQGGSGSGTAFFGSSASSSENLEDEDEDIRKAKQQKAAENDNRPDKDKDKNSEDDNSQKRLTTNGTGNASINDLYQFVSGKGITGKYTLTETKAPNGYVNNLEEISFVVSKNGAELEANVENQENLTSLKSVEVEGNTIKLIIQDKPLFKLTKTDKETGEPLVNAKFIIYEIDDEGNELDFAKDVNGNYVGTLNSKNQYEIVTNEEGEVTIPLGNGTYKAIEIDAPTGYEKKIQPEIFRITGNEENQEIGTPDEFDNTLEINYIEDLVDLSENVRNGNTYSGTKVILKRTLDFTDSNSYRNANDSTTYGDYNLDGNIEDIKTELTTGIGFKGIGYGSSNPFSGIFDGQNNEINGININHEASAPANTGENFIRLTDDVALFRYVEDGKIKKLN